MMPSRQSSAATPWSTGKLHQLSSSNSLLKILAHELLHRQGLNHRQLVCRSHQCSSRGYTVQWAVLNGLAAFKLKTTSPILMEIVTNIVPPRRDTLRCNTSTPSRTSGWGCSSVRRPVTMNLTLSPRWSLNGYLTHP